MTDDPTTPTAGDGVTLQKGSRLGPYEIVSFLGAGGMGEVYRARDTRLLREVAIKVLPAELASDRERLKRFEREARAASALNHPNIVTIHEVGSFDSCAYIAMEFVGGDSLRKQLVRGALPIKRVLQIGSQIADGLARAHEAGIVHRDLKPENVMVARDGLVKILDFGLAKRRGSPALQDQTSTPTETATEKGVLLGTVGYMSPEQVSGGEVDHRSDQFSLGAVLYEMATGRRAFQRKTSVDTMSAILNEEPQPIAAVTPSVPTPLRWVIERCLAKAPEDRYAATRDLARDLALARDRLTEAGTGELPAARPRRIRAAVLAALAAALASAAAAYFVGVRRGESKAPSPNFRQLTFRRGGVASARFTPDGRTVIYSGAWDGEPQRLFSTRIDSPGSTPLELTAADLAAVSSAAEILMFPDRLYGAVTHGPLSRVPLSGGAPRLVAEDAWFADWSPDGKQIALVRRAGANDRLEYPAGRTLLEDYAMFAPRVSRDGRRIAYHTSRQRRSAVSVVDLTGRAQTLSTGWRITGTYLAWSPSGDEVWFSAATEGWATALHAVALSGRERLMLRLPGSIDIHDVSQEGQVLLTFGKRREEIRCRLPGWEGERNLSWFEASKAQDLSDDGENLLFTETGETAPAPVAYLRSTDGSPPQRLGEGVPLSIAPDGTKVLASDHQGLLILPTGPGESRRVDNPQAGGEWSGVSWFPDSRRVLAAHLQEGRVTRSYALDTEGGKPQPLTPDGFWCDRLAPEGKSAICATPEGTRLYGFETKEAQEIPGLEPGDEVLKWSSDGNFLYVQPGQEFEKAIRIYRIELASGERQLWREVGPIETAALAPSVSRAVMTPNGESYCYTAVYYPNDLYLVEGLR